MTDSNTRSNSTADDDCIDRSRIVAESFVPDEYFCSICQALLWEPRSCASCQQLFCQKCISRWLNNPISAKKCPFRCSVYEERRCPPAIQSLLSRLNIRCRNDSFGCTQIVPYNSLKQHETVECAYLTERCPDCQELVLVEEMDEHRQTPGLCFPRPVNCTFCQTNVDRSAFTDHFHHCVQKRMNTIWQAPTHVNNTRAVAPYLAMIYNWVDIQNRLEKQRELGPLPTTLVGVDAVVRARERGCGVLYHIFLMLTFLLANGPKAFFFIMMFSGFSLAACAHLTLIGCCVILRAAGVRPYLGTGLLMLLSYGCSQGVLFFLRMTTDLTIIYFVALFLLLTGCCFRVPLEVLERNDAFALSFRAQVSLCGGTLLAMKIGLLLCRLYFWLVPMYLTAGMLAWVSFFLAFHLTHSIRYPTRNQTVQTMTTT